jgi:hypothetical protein
MSTTEPPEPEPRDDVDADTQGEPDDDVREALAEPPAEEEGAGNAEGP